jgi:hypothetical protein
MHIYEKFMLLNWTTIVTLTFELERQVIIMSNTLLLSSFENTIHPGMTELLTIQNHQCTSMENYFYVLSVTMTFDLQTRVWHIS